MGLALQQQIGMVLRMMQKKGWNNRDVVRWKEQGWIEKNRPWKLQDKLYLRRN